MAGFISNFFMRRKLRPIVNTLPFLLRKKYGESKFYTAGQVTSALALLKINGRYFPYGLATACSAPDFAQVEPTRGEAEYVNLRNEISRLFWLSEPSLNCESLRSKFRSPKSLNAAMDTIGAGYYSGAGGKGDD